MRTTPATVCLLALLAACGGGADRDTDAALDRPLADTVGSLGAAGDTAAADAVNWAPAPPALPAGARFAVMEGDPSKPGPFTMRLELPSGYEVRPHTHPASEQLRVVEGALMLGMGKKWNDAGLKPLAVGEEASVGAKEPHFVRAKERTVLEVKSTGPFEITYVNPADDPRKAAGS